MKNSMYILLISFLFLVGACSDSTSPQITDVLEKEALLYWQGEYAVDGCGFFVQIDSKMYKPANEDFISDSYKNNTEAHIRVKFRYLDEKIKSYCFDAASPIETNAIEIIEISEIIQGSLLGQWEWVESSGGIAGVTIIPETAGYSKTYNFISDTTLNIYRNDTLITETSYRLSGDTLKIAGQDIVQLVQFRSNRIILYDQCIDCFINVFERKNTEPELIRVSGIWYTLDLQSDPVEIYNVSVNGDVINLDVGYSGCVGHDFELFTPSFFMESSPVQSRLELYHKSSYDMCPVFSTETVAFSLLPLKELYQDYYGEHGMIKLNIYVMGDSLKFAEQPLYEF